ncbi:MAG: hypothetical protein JST52_01045 [Bacteroidetes bacterium]|nr:hypothetical protein [Bacteroidota bacterium]MBS1740417.1 hypothetical protein [Bacteroidota bacterium]
MKRTLFFALLLVGVGLMSCDNGNYNASPSNGGSNSVNPLNPTGGMNTSFDWSGDDPMSMTLNGQSWKADVATSANVGNDHIMLTGLHYGGDTSQVYFYLNKNTQPGKSVYIFYQNTDNIASYMSNFSDNNSVFLSTGAQLGEVKILENDNTHIKGLFYFLARSPKSGDYINIQKGYFNVAKP